MAAAPTAARNCGAGTHAIRHRRDAMSRLIITELDRADIGIASATYEIVGFPAIGVKSREPVRQV